MNLKTDPASRRILIGNVKKQYKNTRCFHLPDNDSQVLVCTDTKFNSEAVSKRSQDLQNVAIAKHSGKLNNNNFDLVSVIDFVVKE